MQRVGTLLEIDNTICQWQRRIHAQILPIGANKLKCSAYDVSGQRQVQLKRPIVLRTYDLRDGGCTASACGTASVSINLF